MYILYRKIQIYNNYLKTDVNISIYRHKPLVSVKVTSYPTFGFEIFMHELISLCVCLQVRVCACVKS